jgi:uncharacterized protein involved in response to NO
MRRTVPGLPSAPAAAGRPLDLVSTVPHRFFFGAGLVSLALAALWWAWTIVARLGYGAPPAAVPPTTLHAFLMVYGFAPFFMFGFLFTAGPRWLGVEPPPSSHWRPPGIVAAVTVLAMLPLQLAPAWATQVAAGGYALAWAAVLARFVALIRASPVVDKVHAKLVALALAAGCAGVAAFALAGAGAHVVVKLVGVWLFLLPVFVVVCHRMIPFFTSGVVPFVTAFRPWWLLAAMLAAPVAHGVLEALGASSWTFVVDAPAALLMLAITLRWGLVQSLGNRLLAMLHVGFVWFGIGFGLFAISSLAERLGVPGLGLAPMHALTIGFASSLLMAMVTRVICGHSGRTLAADTLTWYLFLLLQVAAVARIAAERLPWSHAYACAALLFASSFVPWVAKYAPLTWRARADGRPG